MERYVSLVGVFALMALAIPLSKSFKKINWKPVLWGLVLQVVFAVLVLGIPALGWTKAPLAPVFVLFNDAFNWLIACTNEGSEFLFGSLVTNENFGMIFAFRVLPTIVFFSSVMAVLYHLNVMQFIVRAFSVIMQKTMGTSGAETLSASANIFVGQTEAPLMIRPYVTRMTESELFCVMVGGMASVAGGVMAAYVSILQDRMENIAGHLLTASIMSAPAALAIAKIIMPETATPETLGTTKIQEEKFGDANVIDAAARGASDGLQLAFNVGGMLLAFIALIFMINSALGWLGGLVNFDAWGQALVPGPLMPAEGEATLSLEVILGWVLWPIAFLMGVPVEECSTVGALIGQKIVLNEFVAYLTLDEIGSQLSDRAFLISSYALCGFANFSSIAIQIGGIGGIAPTRRSDLARFGVRAVFGGTLAACLTGTIAGILI